MYAPDPNRPDASKQLVTWSKLGIKGCGELKTTLKWNAEPVRSYLATVARLRLPLIFHMQAASEDILSARADGPCMRMMVRALVSRRLPGFRSKRPCEHARIRALFKAFLFRRTVRFSGYLLGFPELEAQLKAFPDVQFIGHGPEFWKHLPSASNSPPEPGRREGITYRLLRTYANLHADISGYSGFCALNHDPRLSVRFLQELGHKVLFGTDNVINDHEALIRSFHLPAPLERGIFGENACRLIQSTPARPKP
jgi:hypothetical protein